jgi:hypothetical protein
VIVMTSSSTLGRTFPTLRYLAAPFRWFFRSRRRALTASAILVAMIAVPPVWWSVQLMGLPDIGDPFNLQEFQSLRIPDDRNAYILYRQAAAALKPLKSSLKPAEIPSGQPGPHPKDNQEARRWVEENREAMELYRQGTERPDALDLVMPNTPHSWEVIEKMRSFHVLALIEMSRLEQQGDMAGAWGWYRAALRATHHICLRGSTVARMNAHRWQRELLERATFWAADRRTTPALLRRALDDVLACEAFTPSESYTIKAEYPRLDRALDGSFRSGRYRIVMQWQAMLKSSNYRLTPEQLESLADAWRFWRRERERSRRVIRLAVANWLAYWDLPPDRRPKPAPDLSGPYEFYAFGPEAPAKARTLTPEALDHWLATTTDANELLRGFSFQGLRLPEQANHRTLVVLLATQLYRRDHGSDPPSEKALVGPYLKSLPDDGTGTDEAGPIDGGTRAVPESAGPE